MKEGTWKKCVIVAILLLSTIVPLNTLSGYSYEEEPVCLPCSVFETQADWYINWSYYRKITINHNMVGSNLTNFPILVSMTDSNLASHAQSDGDDIMFVDSDNISKYNHQIELYNDTTGELVAWVNITNLSSTEDTVLWMYYGNNNCGNQQNEHGTWDMNYMMVQHLNESPNNGVAGHIDSTSNNNNGTPDSFNNNPTSTTNGTGKIDGADIFDGADDNINCTDIEMGAWTALTVELWAEIALNTDIMIPLAKHDVAQSPGNFFIRRRTNVNGGWEFYVRDDSDADWERVYTSDEGDVDTCYYIAATVDASTNKVIIYMNAIEKMNVSTFGSATLSDSDNYDLVIGADSDTQTPNQAFNGTIDEVRISNIARSPDWINASFHNQNQTTGFLTIGEEFGVLGDWWNTNWDHYRTITLDHTKIDSDLFNFPVLVVFDNSSYHIDSSNSIRFIAGSNSGGIENETEYNYEIEKWDDTGNCYIWVNVTEIYSASDTVFNMYYNNSEASDGQNIAGTWDANYIMVQHLDDEDSLLDSTSNDNDGTKSGNIDNNESYIGNAMWFDGTGDYITVLDSASLSAVNTFTYQGWFKFTKISNNPRIFDKHNSAGGYDNEYFIFMNSADELTVQLYDGNDDNLARSDNTDSHNDGTWHLFTFNYDGSLAHTGIDIYVDGVEVDNSGSDTNPGMGSIYDGADNVHLGGTQFSDSHDYSGYMDEVRFSKVERNVSWIKADFHSQNQTSGFLAFSKEFTMPIDWWDNSYGNMKQLVINHSYIDSDLVNFPVLVTSSNTAMLSKMNGGDSLRFVDATNTFEYNFEIEYFDDTDKMVVWVNITFISSSVDTAFNMYYNNNTVPDGQNVNGVWNSNYVGVWHMSESPVGAVLDSTSYSNDLTSAGSMTADNLTDGKIGKAIKFDGINDYLYHAADAELKPTYVTLTMWGKIPPGEGGNLWTIGLQEQDQWSNYDSCSYGISYNTDNPQVKSVVAVNNGNGQFEGVVNVSWLNDSWCCGAMSYETGHQVAYVNGTSGSDITGNGLDYDGTTNLYIMASRTGTGGGGGVNRYQDGTVDEVRISDIARNSSWINASFNSQNQTTDFLTFSSEYTIAPITWCDNDWAYYKAITVNHNQVPSDLSNFPILVNITDTDLIHCAQSDGDDIAFVTIDNETQYNHEIEIYNSSTGHLVAWVNITELSSTSDTLIWMYYGNPCASNQQNIIGTWDSDFISVHHMSNLNDSANNYDLTNHGATLVTGEIGNCYDFEHGENDYMDDTTYYDISSQVAYTMEAWFKWENAYSWAGVCLGTVAGNDWYRTASITDNIASDSWRATMRGTGVKRYCHGSSGGVATDFHQVTGTFTSTTARLSTDGTYRAYSNSGTMSFSDITTDSFTIGKGGDADWGTFDGKIDEVRISKIVRSDDWITTAYNTINNGTAGPSGFINISAKYTGQVEWYNDSWSNRKSVILDADQIPSTQSNFPVCINITDTDLRDNAQSDGDDIMFVSWDNTTQYNHEIELYNNTTGCLVAWVNVTDLDSTCTAFWMYYNNPTCANQQNVAGTWDSNFVMVQHLNETPSDGVKGHIDSTINNNDGRVALSGGSPFSTTNAVGKIDGADAFDGSTDNVRVDNSPSLNPDYITVEAWIKFVDVPYDYGAVVAKEDYDPHPTDKGYSISINATGKLVPKVYTNNNNWLWYNGNGSKTMTADTWYHIAFTYNGTEIIGYVNGEFDNSSSEGASTIQHVTDYLYIGKSGISNKMINGTIDEVRLSNVARTPAWINTCFNTMNNATNGSFFTMGFEELKSDIAPTNSNPSPTNGAIGVSPNPTLQITVNDADGDTMNQSFWTNASGTWLPIAWNNNTLDATLSNTTTVFISYSTKYFWSSNVTDGDDWGNNTYYFTTIGDPVVTTNATTNLTNSSATLNGYLSDDGGENCTVRFEWGLTVGYGNTTSNQSKSTGQSFYNIIATNTTSLRPNAIGDVTQLSTTGCTENWQCVDDVSPDYDTTVVRRNGGSDDYRYDLYNITNHDNDMGGIIRQVNVFFRCRSAVSETKFAYIKLKTNGVEYNGTIESYSPSWSLRNYIYTTNPITGVAWTWDDIDNLQVGVALWKDSLGFCCKCTQIYVNVTYMLTPDTIYHYRAVANNSNSTVYGADMTFTTISEPINSNPYPADGATGLGLNPTLQITINSSQGYTMNQTFYTNASGTWTAIGWNNNSANATVSNTTSCFNTPNTLYWWSSNVTNVHGYWDNDTYYFTIIATQPVVTTNESTNITNSSATLNGYLSDDGDGDYCNVWFEWGETDSYGNITGLCISNNMTLAPNANGSYQDWGTNGWTKVLTNDGFTSCIVLAPASNRKSTYQMENYTINISNTEIVSVECHGILYVQGGLSACRICLFDTWGGYTNIGGSWTHKSTTWTTNPNTGNNWSWSGIDDLDMGVWCYGHGYCTQIYGVVNYMSSNTTDGTSFSYDLLGLSTGTTYYYRSVASNSNSTTYGAGMTFRIMPPVPVTNQTYSFDDVTQNITINWTRGSYSDYTLIRRDRNNYPANTTDGTLAYNNTGNGTIETTINQSYYTLWAYNSTWNSYSSPVHLNTVREANVTTNASTSIEETNATLQGYLSSDGGENCSVWFEWGETDSYGNTTTDFFTLLDIRDDGGWYEDVWCNETYIYTACNIYGVRAYTFNGSSFTLNATQDDGDEYRAVWSDGTYIYTACDGSGVRAYSFNGSAFTLLDTQSDSNGYYSVWGDGTYIYTTYADGSDGSGGIHAYTFNGSAFTLLDTQSDSCFYWDVWGDGTYIYTACDSSGIRAYSFNGASFTLLDTHDDGGSYKDIWSDETYIYVACSTDGVRAYTFNGSAFTLLDTQDDGNNYNDIWGDGICIYTTCSSAGIRAYSFNGSAFTLLDTQSSGETRAVWGDGTYIYVASFADGVYAYNTWEHTSSGNLFDYDLTILISNTIYHYRAVAINSNSTTYGSDMTFHTMPPDTVTNQTYNFNITTQNITLNWTKGNYSDYTLIRRARDGYPSTITDGTLAYNNTSDGIIDTVINQSYYSLWAYNSTWNSYSSPVYLTTLRAPNVTTNATTGVEENDAILHGYLSDDGGENCNVSFEWGDTTGYGNSSYYQYFSYNPVNDNGDGGTDASSTVYLIGTHVDGHSISTEHIVCPSQTIKVDKIEVDVKSTSGTDYGCLVDIYIAQESPDFTPSEGTLVKNDWNPDWSSGWQTIIFNQSYTLINDSTYSINFVTSNASGVSNYLVIDVDTSGGSWKCHSGGNSGGSLYSNINFLHTGNTTGDCFSSYIDGLSPGTIYHYRAVANNSNNTVYGADMTFLTKPLAPTSFGGSQIGLDGIRLTWTKGTGANTTYIERNTVSPWARGVGVMVYNNTGISFDDSGLETNTTYYYQAWSCVIGSCMYSSSNASVYVSTQHINVTPATNVQDTTATLNGLWYGASSSCGFYYGIECNCTHSNFEHNVTVGTFANESFSKSITVLSLSNCYCFKSWAASPSGFCISNLTEHFLTKPSGPPGSLVVTNIDVTNVTMGWSNVTDSSSQNVSQESIIRYSTTSYPLTPTSGTLGYNGIAENCTITGLEMDTQYYFSAWTHITANCNGTYCSQNSSEFSVTTAYTQGGIYNITVRYENSTYGLVNLSEYGPHNVIIHYYGQELDVDYGGRDLITFNNGVCTHDPMVEFNSSQMNNGSFNFSVNRTIQYIEFNWNDSTECDYRCNRIISPVTNQRNITFYIRTDLPVFAEGTNYMNGSIVKYLYSFVDETGKFKYPNNPRATIFVYNNAEEKMIIHSEYFDDTEAVHPWLVYEKEYFIGVDCSLLTYERVGIAPASENQNPEVRIPYEYVFNYSFFELIELEISWYDSGFYVHYYDTTFSTEYVTFDVYGYYNHTLLYSTNTTLSIKNFTYPCNVSNNYIWIINTTINDVENIYDGTYTSQEIPMFSGMAPITDVDTIDDILTIILGRTPLHDTDNPDIEVPWTYIMIFALAFIVLTSLGKLNAFVGAMGVGFVLTFSGGAIMGLQTLFTNYDWWNGPVLIVIGVFVIAFAIVGLMGGVED